MRGNGYAPPLGELAPAAPRPVPGDHVTLYTYDQASPWLHLHPSTIRRMVNTGEIPARYITRAGAATRGKVFMTGDQICGLIAFWSSGGAGEPAAPGPQRRRRTVRAGA